MVYGPAQPHNQWGKEMNGKRMSEIEDGAEPRKGEGVVALVFLSISIMLFIDLLACVFGATAKYFGWIA